MTFVALWIPAPPTDAAATRDRARDTSAGEARAALLRALLRVTPHALAEPRETGALVWADARGLAPRRVAAGALRAARAAFADEADVVRLGVARVALVAEVAARHAGAGTSAVLLVAPRHERRFLADRPLTVLAQTPPWSRRLAAALADVGIERCGDLAALPLSAVEVRFGADGAALWRLARADDLRRVFTSAPPAHPSASVEWSEFAVRDAERLLFFANGLAGRVCADLRARGEATRAMTLRLMLAGGGAVEHPVRAARAGATRVAWLHLLRRLLERITLPDAVCGLALRVDAAHAADLPQGDLFDAGFQTGEAGEAAVARLLEDGDATPVHFVASAHALPEQRGAWRAAEPGEVLRALRPALRDPVACAAPPAVVRETPGHMTGPTPGRGVVVADLSIARVARPTSASASVDRASLVHEPLALRVLPAPVRLLDTGTHVRRGFRVPTWYCPPGAARVDVLTVAGPDCVDVGAETGVSATREYWQCTTDDGRLVLLFRDAAADDAWYLHGWWD